MRALKAVLVVVGVVCVLTGLGAVAPWWSLVRVVEGMGLEAPPAHPLVLYCLRMTCTAFALMGVFFLVLASDPLRYRPMLVLAVCGLWLLALVALATGWVVRMHSLWYLGDAAAGVIAAVLIVAFWPKEGPRPAGS